MAWLILRANDNPVPTSWKAGDIVEMRTDAQVAAVGWGRLETLPALYRVQVTGLNENVQTKMLVESIDASGSKVTDDYVINRVRRYRLHVALLPQSKQNELTTTGTTTITVTQAVAAIRDNGGGIIVLP